MLDAARSVMPTRAAMSRKRIPGSAARHTRTWAWLDKNVHVLAALWSFAFRRPTLATDERKCLTSRSGNDDGWAPDRRCGYTGPFRSNITHKGNF